jgi:hypothetical protein
VEIICMMPVDYMDRKFLEDSRNTFQDFKVGKPGTASEKHICSSEKMHRCLHAGTKITEYGNIMVRQQAQLLCRERGIKRRCCGESMAARRQKLQQ